MEEVTKTSASGAQNRLEDMRQQFTEEYVTPAIDSMKEMVGERPMSTVLTAFGAGFAVGLVVATSLASTMPNRRRNYGAMHRLGEQVLEAMTNVLPQSVASQFQR